MYNNPEAPSPPEGKASTSSMGGTAASSSARLLEGGGGDESSATVTLAACRNTTSVLELQKAIAACEMAAKVAGAIHPAELSDRLKQAAALSLLARCYLALHDRAQCEQTSLKLALLQVIGT